MEQPDGFSEYYQDLLEGRYDCPDRIVLNGYFSLGQAGGGFRYWWRRLTGSDETLDQEHLLRRFSRRVHAFAKPPSPPIHCEPGVRKHELAEQHRPPDPTFTGLFLILVAKAPAPVWDVTPSRRGVPHLTRKTPWPYVNHYHFHVIDKEWGAPDLQAERASPLRRAGHAQRSRMGRTPRRPADHLGAEGG